MTIIERIFSSDKESTKISTEILFKISLFLQKLTGEDKAEPFRQMISNGFGLVLLKTPIFLDVESTVRERMLDIHRRQAFGKWLQTTTAESIKETINKIMHSGFATLLNSFFNSIRIGDMNKTTQAIDSDTNGCIMNMKDYSGRTCLHLSVLYGRLQLTK